MLRPSFTRVLVAVPVLLACGAAAAAPSWPVDRPLPAGFARSVERIAAQYDCPPAVLWAIATVRSGGVHRSVPALDGAVGVAGLVPHGTPSLELAATLAGVPADAARRDPEANLRAAAALLALFHQGQPVGDDEATRWVRAAAGFAGGDDPAVVHLFLTDLLDALARPDARAGADARLRFAPLAVDRVAVLAPWPLLQSRAADYGDALWVAANSGNYTVGRGGNSIQYIIVHVMQGSYAGSISWFQNASASASAHYMLRSSDGQITQMVEEGNTAWHAGNWSYNQRSIGLEHEGYIDAPDTWFTEEMYQSSADLVAYLCDKYDIPKDRAHILGHNEVPDPNNPALFGGAGHHTDPGAYWDWDHYMDLINGVQPPLETGSLVGYVREFDIYTGAGIAGATVALSDGSSATTNASGYYAFASLPVGDYTVTASATGYVTASDTKYVTAGVQNWKSIALQKVTCTPSCSGKTCGSDGCGGTCGQCSDGQTCSDGTCACVPDDHRGCCGDAVCSMDSCGNVGDQIEACPYGCADATCMTCQPNCFLSDCGSDGCGGTCGECWGGQQCMSGLCVCVAEAEQDCCFDAICWFDSCGTQGAQVAACENGCANGACLDCTPACDGLTCGPDGCGGMCGTCSDGRQCVAGLCVCAPNDHKACCGSDVCWYDSCGTSEGLDADCKYGCLDGACTSCYPACDGHECGADGCGGSCGTCGAGKTCSGGSCVCKPKDHKGCCGSDVCWFDGCGNAGEQVADCPYDCADAKCTGCQPQCDGLQCGADGCGGECGLCPANQSCRFGKCECDANDHKSCVGNSVYWFDSCDVQGAKIVDCPAGCTLNACLDCTPQCQGATCGPDGCGGECGACPGDQVCVDATCRDATGPDATTTEDVPTAGTDPGASVSDTATGEGSGHYNERDTGATTVQPGGSSGGCSVGAAASPLPALAFLLTALAALRRRRR